MTPIPRPLVVSAPCILSQDPDLQSQSADRIADPKSRTRPATPQKPKRYTRNPNATPETQTLHPKPKRYTRNPNATPETQTHTPHTLHPTPYTLHPKLYTLHPTLYAPVPTPSLNPKHQPLDLWQEHRAAEGLNMAGDTTPKHLLNPSSNPKPLCVTRKG